MTKTCSDCFEAVKYWQGVGGKFESSHQCNRTGLVVDPGRAACALYMPRDGEEVERETTTQTLSASGQPLEA